MSRTSSERRAGADRRFRRAFTASALVLAVLAGALIALGALQGPKTASAQVDAAAAIHTPGQLLRLAANQALAPVDAADVSITPETLFEVRSEGDLVTVRFIEALHYGTEYSVSVSVTGERSGREGMLAHEFTTAPAVLHYLDRGDVVDEIVAAMLHDTEREVVHRAERIQDFAVLRDALAVVRLDGERESAIELVSRTGPAVQGLRLPGPGTVRALDAAASGDRIGFTFTSTMESGLGEYFSTLFTVDRSQGGDVVPVLGLDGEPITTLGWQFVPGSDRMLVLTDDSSLLLIDPDVEGAIEPLGRAAEVLAISPDGSVATVTDSRSMLAIDLASGSSSPIVASPLDGVVPFLGHTQALPNGDRVEKLVLPSPAGGPFTSIVAYDDGVRSSELYRTPLPTGSIERFTLSPNAQYLAIETVPDFSRAQTDGYFVDARYLSTTTVFVEVATGRVVRSVEGFSVDW